MEVKELTFVGVNDWDQRVFKDKGGKLYVDISLSSSFDDMALYTLSINDFDGEPAHPVNFEYKVINK